MVEIPLLVVLAVAAPAWPGAAVRDSVADTSRVVRRFPPIEVTAPLLDMPSSQTRHVIDSEALRTLPIDGFAEVLALQPGVVAQGGETHVRGGRAGETVVHLDGIVLNEALRQRPLELPLLALRAADLVSGAPDARYAGSLAGAIDLETVDPGRGPALEWRWQTDGRRYTRFDRVGARASAPLGLLGLGAVVAGDATLDDTWLPALRTPSRREIAGLSVGWRAENRLLGYLKLAPVAQPQRYSLQVLAGRQVHMPYDVLWTVDGWTFVPPDPKSPPVFSADPLPGYVRYRAADHMAITDDRHLGTIASWSALGATRRATVTAAWLHTRTVTSPGGGRESGVTPHRARFGDYLSYDQFHVLWGDFPIYRESGSDVLTLRGDGEMAMRTGAARAGAGLTYDEVTMREIEWQQLGYAMGGEPPATPLDSVRTYHAFAPGGFAYVQGRWSSGAMVMNGGLRAEYFSPGPQADRQTLPGAARGVWSLSPRLGITYPISVRDAFSLAYYRIHQSPGRDYLYDSRRAIGNRQPLGNPALSPSTVIAYEATVKHLFDAAWALQASMFFRDVFGQIGARDLANPAGAINLSYMDADEGHALGFEWSLLHAAGERRRLEARYTWMVSWGSESRPEGDPYGTIRGERPDLIGDRPLSWDRRHTLLLSGALRWPNRVSLAWSTLVGSPLPWTPKELRQPLTDPAAVNSRRFRWSETTNLNLQWSPPRAFGLVFGLEARNLFDHRGERAATVDGYPNPVINTLYDDYGAYRAESGLGGGAYWSTGIPGQESHWVRVGDPRLFDPPRALRASVGASW